MRSTVPCGQRGRTGRAVFAVAWLGAVDRPGRLRGPPILLEPADKRTHLAGGRRRWRDEAASPGLAAPRPSFGQGAPVGRRTGIWRVLLRAPSCPSRSGTDSELAGRTEIAVRLRTRPRARPVGSPFGQAVRPRGHRIGPPGRTGARGSRHRPTGQAIRPAELPDLSEIAWPCSRDRARTRCGPRPRQRLPSAKRPSLPALVVVAEPVRSPANM